MDHELRQPGLQAFARRHAFEFAGRLGAGETPIRVAFAPGRVNLMGAHLDYNGGPVMPMAIDRGTFVAWRPRSDGRVTLQSTLEAGDLDLALAHPPRERTGSWVDYPLGVLLAALATGPQTRGLDLLFGGNLPIGGGLSSSASICVATALALDLAWSCGRTRLDFVEQALWAEREFVGVKCGIMDPYAVAFSRPQHLLWLDCKDRSTEHLPYDSQALTIAVADSGVRRDLARGDFNERVQQCAQAFELLRAWAPSASCLRDVPLRVLEQNAHRLDPSIARRARHVLEEVARTFAARQALLAGDHATLGRCMNRAHQSLRELFEVSIPELDLLVESAQEYPGIFGARLTGAGFGGCAVVILAPSAKAGLAEHMQARFEARFGRRPRIDFFQGDPGPREF